VNAFPASRAPTDEAGEIAWLRLARSERIGPVTFAELMRRYPNAQAALDALPDLAAKGGGKRAPKVADAALVAREYEAGKAVGARLLALGGADYPVNLAMVDAAPPLLWCLGDPAVARPQAVGIVGARNASALGLRFTETLARDLGKAGRAVISGLARGVDAAAHRGSVETGTVAVLAGGVDSLWPPQNAALYDEIVAKGAILSERPMGYQGRAQDFPRRNRLVSGLSQGVVVAEGAERSGSLITARYAGEQGREVMAVPGSPLDPRAGGCNLLIREGATLVRGIDDVLEALARIGAQAEMLAPREEDWDAPMVGEDAAMRQTVLDLLGPHPVDVDEIIRRSGASAGFVSLVLLELDLAGRLHREAGGGVALA
jgi:DNA processing protein